MKLRKKTETPGDAPALEGGDASAEAPLMKCFSHEKGRNAEVFVYADRIERRKAGAVFARETETTPIRAISSVQVTKDGMVMSKVILHAVGNPIVLRTAHPIAAELGQMVSRLIIEASATPAAVAAAPSSLDELSKLHDLFQAGVLNEAEFAEHKQRLLQRA